MSHATFYALLSRHPRIAPLWDQQANELRIDLFKRELRVMSDGERDLAKFFAAVWFGDNARLKKLTGAPGFDLVDAMSRADSRTRATYAEWMASPFWP